VFPADGRKKERGIDLREEKDPGKKKTFVYVTRKKRRKKGGTRCGSKKGE